MSASEEKSEIQIKNHKRAASCSSYWEQMQGTDKFRVCSTCQMNVYQFSGLSEAEIRQTVYNREGKDTPVFFERSDGTFLSGDCPVGLANRRNLAYVVGAGLLALIGLLMTPLVVPKTAKQSDVATTSVNHSHTATIPKVNIQEAVRTFGLVEGHRPRKIRPVAAGYYATPNSEPATSTQIVEQNQLK